MALLKIIAATLTQSLGLLGDQNPIQLARHSLLLSSLIRLVYISAAWVNLIAFLFLSTTIDLTPP
jgi:hypothetical protein